MDRSIVGKWKDRGRAAMTKWQGLSAEEQGALEAQATLAEERPYIDFFDDLMSAMPRFELSCLAVMQAAKNAGDARIAYIMLKMKFPEYRETVKLTADEDEPVHTRALPPMSDEERTARAKRAREMLDAMEDPAGPAP